MSESLLIWTKSQYESDMQGLVMELKDKNVMVVGSGISGISATQLLSKLGAKILLFDGNSSAVKSEIEKRLTDTKNVEIVIGELTEESIKTLDLVVLSPGVPTDIPMVLELKEKNIPVWGEIELAYVAGKGSIAAITGTNGKTTTTALVGKIMETYYESTFVVGNIGIPYTGIALDTNENSVVVAEISSFQLETIQKFQPKVSAILNITPDHLNRHHTMENYIQTKLDITKNQTPKDVCVLNYEDHILREKSKEIPASIIYFSSVHELENGIYLTKDGRIVWTVEREKTEICNIQELNLLGTHNYENVMAAIAMGMAMGVPVDLIKKAVTNFVAVEHRIEFVAEKNGVKYYNDSKGTNPDAAIKGIQAMVTPTLLIGGGYDKESEYEEWIRSFDGKVKQLVLIGQTRDKIAEAARRCGFYDIVKADSLEEAMEICRKNAVPGDSVLLSPACASWGMFKNYEERGDIFKELVHKM